MGFGALGQGDAKTAIIEALKAGYRSVCVWVPINQVYIDSINC